MKSANTSLFRNYLKIYLLLPFLFPLILLTSNEYIIAAGVALLIGMTLLLGYRRREWIVVVAGISFGIIAEIGGDMIYKLQYWEQASFFGIPLWLPLLWGFGFLYMGRVYRLIVDNK